MFMKLRLKELKNIFSIIDVNNIDDEEIFDYFRCGKIYDDKLIKDCINPLYFFFSIDKKELDNNGWYVNEIDNRDKINDYLKDNVYVVDKETVKYIDNEDYRYIVVDDVLKCIDMLSSYSISLYNGKAVLVTGSVGKTSTVGLIENVIQDKVLRIYSKRITPVIFASYVVNVLNNNYDYVVMESGLYRKFHVEYYSKILKPYIGCLINIDDSHIGIDGISNRVDILVSKAKMLLHCDKVVLNNNDQLIKDLKFDNNKLMYKDIFIGEHNINEVVRIEDFNKNLIPFIDTNLSQVQDEVAYRVGQLLNIDNNTIINRINNYVPVENRIEKILLDNKTTFFDGEVSSVPRLKMFCDNNYSSKVLVIRWLTTGGENEYDFSGIVDFFDKFDKVYVFSDVKQLKEIKNDRVEVVDNYQFINSLNDDVVIFYHFGSYYRNNDISILEYIEKER